MNPRSILAALAAFVASPLFASETSLPFPTPERIRYDAHGLQIEGKDTFIYGGAFHCFRVPKEL